MKFQIMNEEADVNLTKSEKEIIIENQNILALGRSGTGKTTSAVFRMAML